MLLYTVGKNENKSSKKGAGMRFYFAPFDGITGQVYRNAFHSHFKGIDKYFMPFIKPKIYGHISKREREELDPENNKGMVAVPQLLTNDTKDFLMTAARLQQFGYTEVNLNLGCPSKPVVAKGRGSGFLADPKQLDQFLETIFATCEMKISVKTRIGKEHPEEFEQLLEIFNKYPIHELIIHPRVQQDFYENTPNWNVFAEALKISKNPVCYNGDIFTTEDYQQVLATFPALEMVMLGRGVLRNPQLLGHIRGGDGEGIMSLRGFHDQIYDEYRRLIPDERTILFKMKELWFYLIKPFEEGDISIKKVRQAAVFSEYEAAVERLFEELIFG